MSGRKHLSFIFKLLLILFVILILIGTFLILNKIKSDTNLILGKTNHEASEIKPISSTVLPLYKTNNWKDYSNQEGSFSLKYPTNWVVASNSKICPSGTFDRSVYLADNTNSLLKCPNQLLSQIQVISLVGDQTKKYIFSADTFSNISQSHLKINNQSAIKETAFTRNALKQPPLPPQSFYERYLIFDGTNTFFAQYILSPTGKIFTKNELKNFDLLVQRTLTFHP
ncbi:MAG TPA: hypothetical protein VLF63_01580 [Patescibacteria group bacterium]|nr:hypothetical protein [Patescibacteria group bacterium]